MCQLQPILHSCFAQWPGHQDTLAENEGRINIHRTKYPGNSAVALRSDARICAVAGWDGKYEVRFAPYFTLDTDQMLWPRVSVRLYSTKSFKPLGTLKYHGQSVYAVAFAHGSHTLGQPPQPSIGSGDVAETGPETDDQEDDWWEQTDSERRCRWLVTAGKEGRVAFWLLDTFEKG